MLRQNVAILHPFFFLLFFLFFILLHPRPQAVLSSGCRGLSGGRQEPESHGEGNFPLKLEELWSQECGENPISFLLLLLFCCLTLTSGTALGSTQQNGVNEASAFSWKAGEGESQGTRRLQENEDLGKLTT